MRRRCIRLLLVISFSTAAGSPASAFDAATVECFDAEVSAAIVRQTPTVAPECADCIIIRWPWIVDLRVQRIRRGAVALGPVTVLTLQHTYYRTDRSRRWLLRRNTLGSFNVVFDPEQGRLPRCPTSAPAARPYIRPGDGRTLDDLRREGEVRYGRHGAT